MTTRRPDKHNHSKTLVGWLPPIRSSQQPWLYVQGDNLVVLVIADLYRSIVLVESTTQARLAANYNTPLAKLSVDELALFREAIVFRDGIGMVGFRYAGLVEALSPQEIWNVFAYFGLTVKMVYGYEHQGVRIANDIPGYECICDPSVCAVAPDYICLNSCA